MLVNLRHFKRKLRLYLAIIPLSVLLATCAQSTATPISPTVTTPSLTLSQTPSPTSKATIAPTSTPTIAPTLPFYRGSIWIGSGPDFIQYDLESGEIEEHVFNPGCSFILTAYKKVFCRNTEEQVYLIDIETGREEMTSIKREEFLYISSNEQYFLYAVFNEESENYTISVYDHTTSTSQALLNALDLPWRGLIDVSPLDLRLAANISGQIYILQNDLTNTQQISDLDGYHNFAEGISWSPDGSKTIYLAEDLSSADEIATTRDLALYDLETVQLHLIEIGAIYPVPGDTAWSPDSQMIALTNLQDVLCIIDVGSVTHRCFNLIEQFGESSLGWYDWSPYEHKLALTVWMEEIEALNLYIFDPASGEFQLVAANITGGWVSWTK